MLACWPCTSKMPIKYVGMLAFSRLKPSMKSSSSWKWECHTNLPFNFLAFLISAAGLLCDHADQFAEARNQHQPCKLNSGMSAFSPPQGHTQLQNPPLFDSPKSLGVMQCWVPCEISFQMLLVSVSSIQQ